MKRIGLLCLLLSLIAGSASASVYATATGNWTNPNIWDKGYVPNDTEEIKIASTDYLMVTIDTDTNPYTTSGTGFVNQRIGTCRDNNLWGGPFQTELYGVF